MFYALYSMGRKALDFELVFDYIVFCFYRPSHKVEFLESVFAKSTVCDIGDENLFLTGFEHELDYTGMYEFAI